MQKELKAGADICKVVTSARSFEDNLSVLQLIRDFPAVKVVAFAMGPEGMASRVLAPHAGAYFTYGAVQKGKESAPGQIPVVDMLKLYEILPL